MQHNTLAMCSFASSSSGNCMLIKSAGAAVLLDAGISGKHLTECLAELDMVPQDINAILITHEHDDHVRGLKVIAKKTGAQIFLSRGSFGGLKFSQELCGVNFLRAGDELSVGDIRIKSFALSHDAKEPVGYSFSAGAGRISVITDTGVVTEEILRCMKATELLVLESNHDVSMLRMGGYPWFLKQRILGDKGHLSNDAAADAMLQVLKDRAPGPENPRMVLLAHLSRENNFPEMALQTMRNVLRAEGFCESRDLRIEVLPKASSSPVYAV